MPTIASTGVPARHTFTPASHTFADDQDANDHLWALVAEIQAAETDAAASAAFGELYRLTHRTVLRFIRPRVADHATAEDLAADVYVRAYGRVARLTRQSGSPAAWLVTIARNLVADHHKSYRIRKTFTVDDVAPRTPEGRPEWVDAPDLTADAAVSVQDAIALLGAVTRLTGEQREAVRLRYLLGLSVAETAEQLGKLDGAVKALTYRAVRSLARDPEVAALAPAWSGLAA